VTQLLRAPQPWIKKNKLFYIVLDKTMT